MSHSSEIRDALAHGPLRSRQIIELIKISQPTLSRALVNMGDEIIRIGAGPSIQYAIRDVSRSAHDVPVYRIDHNGQLRLLGTLVPVRPAGYVMRQEDGVSQHFDGLPWWLCDMRPQGFLGRAYVRSHANDLNLPDNLREWGDAHVLQALINHGEDTTGNLLLGDHSRDSFLTMTAPTPIPRDRIGDCYTRRSAEAIRGELPGSSAGGEQPKFTAYVETERGPRHVLVKFSVPENNPVVERWRDLLLAEHLAAHTLFEAGYPAVITRLMDHNGQRFLESERFDREGAMGRHALLSLSALDSQFIGMGNGPWPVIVCRLAAEGAVQGTALQGSAFLYAFGTLIGNTDMHFGNLSFFGDHGRPYTLAPAYDMLPMGYAPRPDGSLPDRLSLPNIHASVSNATWIEALGMARDYLNSLQAATTQFSARFLPCIEDLERHVTLAAERIDRLG